MSKNDFFPYKKIFTDNFNTKMPTASSEAVVGANDEILNAKSLIKNPSEMVSNREKTKFPTLVDLPRHLFIPAGAESIDIRKVMNVPSPTNRYKLFEFVAPQGCVTQFIGYGVYNDGDNAVNYNFLPLVNGVRVFRYHGDPTNYYKIALGLAPDLSNNSIIGCQLTLQPNDVLQWLVTNTSGVDTSMGIRMIGYFDATINRVSTKFG